MAAHEYLREKLQIAAETLCAGKGTFEERLVNAHVSAFARLFSNDPPAEVAEELSWILMTCNRHIEQGRCSPVPDDTRYKLAEKLIGMIVSLARRSVNADDSSEDHDVPEEP